MMSSAALAVGVTGAGGFVGRAACAELRARGHAVRPLLRRLQEGCDKAAVPVGDIGPQTNWRDALKGLDVIVHCAAHVHQMGEQADVQAATYHRVNTEGTLHLARCAAQAGVRRLVFISTVKVLGERTPPGRPFKHDSKPHPEDPYGRSKWEAEQGLQHIAAQSDLEVVVIRPPLVYGAGVGANFAALVRLVGSGWPLPLGAIHNHRSMIGKRNLVDLICGCVHHPSAVGQTLLASDGEDMSTAELVRRLALAMGRTARLWPLPESMLHLAGRITGRTAQVRRLTDSLQVDISHTQSLLQWQPPYTVNDELTLTVGAVAVAARHKR